MSATKQELRNEILLRHRIGDQMSNVCFNWSQNETRFSQHEREMMRELYRAWDAIKRAEPAVHVKRVA